jgi:hypothetical protein
MQKRYHHRCCRDRPVVVLETAGDGRPPFFGCRVHDRAWVEVVQNGGQIPSCCWIVSP